ncbi:outer membrane protein assembly factor BamB [Schlegelella sp. S2-27]|uniref:Outer membrane protein assembly factor BamB n=1 Tax=Caldimonas mangrovi TaxID=2944811 RepID=A0ABT0YQJ4_9BURK|nr:outer membrane protein assembly factor BamB [Caldimonas mangrovi]
MNGRAAGQGGRIAVVRLVGAVALLALAACSSAPKKPDPAPLISPAPSAMPVQTVWSERIGDVKLPLRVAVAGDGVTVAASDGSVVHFDAATGKVRWRGHIDATLVAGVGSDGRFTAVVTEGNEVAVLEQGRLLWRERIGSRVVTAPLVAGERVFVYGSDRSVHAYDAQAGGKLWTQRRPGDPLTLSQPGVLLPVRDTLVVGQGPRLAGLDPLRGSVRWEASVASPRGTNEVERLADLVGPAGRDGDTVCVRAFQSAVGCVDALRGGLLWSKTSSGGLGVSLDDRHLYGVDATDKVTAYRRADGEVAWNVESYRFRGLSAPFAVGRSVVVGDAEGYVHFLSAHDGTPLARVATDGSRIIAQPVLAAGLLIVVTSSGSVHALRAQ